VLILEFNFDLKFLWKLVIFPQYEKIMRLKKVISFLELERIKKTWHHHGSDTLTSSRVIYVLKSAKGQLKWLILIMVLIFYLLDYNIHFHCLFETFENLFLWMKCIYLLSFISYLYPFSSQWIDPDFIEKTKTYFSCKLLAV
jgi:hypothetical protein